MRYLPYIIITILFCLPASGYAQYERQEENGLLWEELPALPPASGQKIQKGLAGAFSGVHNDALIIAGGANFPDALPWEGGKKVWWKDIYVLTKEDAENYKWIVDSTFTLKNPKAYGVSVTTDDGVLCIGGNDDSAASSEVFRLRWLVEEQKIVIDSFPSLPFPLTDMVGAKVGEKVFLAGGASNKKATKSFLVLDLNDLGSGWKTLETWKGPERTHAIGIAQNNGLEDCFYLFGGRYLAEDGHTKFLSDAHAYTPSSDSWKILSTIQDGEGNEMALSAGTASASASAHILFFGGDQGKLFLRLEELGQQISSESDSLTRHELILKRDVIYKEHPGFPKTILSYHTITDTWSKFGSLPRTGQVTTNTVKWGDRFIMPTGEISPGIRTPEMWSGSHSGQREFGWINYTVLIGYLLILVVIGYIVSKNQHSTEDFFKAGNRIPWWAAGISIFGTQLSAITFMAIPAKTYATDWSYFFLLMTIILVAPFIIRYFLPFFRRLNVTSAYEYLELRFNLTTRILGSFMYILLQMGRLSIVLLLPSLALSVVTGIDVSLCILIMGILSIAYTVLGGIEAVIWTDVMQVFVLMGGALFCLFFMIYGMDLDWSQTWGELRATNKFNVFDFTWDWSTPTFWVVVFGGFASNIVQYGSDQTVIQRYLTTKDEKSAAKGIKVSALMTLPSAFIFFSIGTALYLFYQQQPTSLSPVMENADAIFPWYIVNELPAGLSGILIAAVFAAAMSSLDSSMNSVSSVIITDYYKRFYPAKGETFYLKLARGFTIIIGVIATGLALMMAKWGISSLWDQFNLVIGLFAGGLGGLFVLGIFTENANGTGAVIGLLISGLAQYYFKEYTELHLLMYAFTGLSVAFLAGYVFSRIIPKATRHVEGLTIYTLKESIDENVR